MFCAGELYISDLQSHRGGSGSATEWPVEQPDGNCEFQSSIPTQSWCRSLFEQDAEPLIVPDEQVGALHSFHVNGVKMMQSM